MPLVDYLLEHNRIQSEAFLSPDAVLARKQYRAQHPTEIAALKCMDGRLLLPHITQTPIGIIQPFRNIGGQFDLGWPFFGKLVEELVGRTIDSGRDTLVLVTYHFSKSSEHHGCRGFNYDTESAYRAAVELKRQTERVFGAAHTAVYPVVIGIETDEDALILHGADGKSVWELASESPMVSEEQCLEKLCAMYPDMKGRIVQDFAPLILGNIQHISEMRQTEREPQDADHCEQVLGIGRGFDWLHKPNFALLIGPYSYNLTDPIAKAGSILLNNLREGRIPEKDGVVLIASAAYSNSEGVERHLAVEKAYSLAQLGLSTLRDQVPDLMPHLHVLVGTLNNDKRFFHQLPFEE